MAIAYVALGSNRGDRSAFIDRAIRALRDAPGVGVLSASRVRETAPVGGPEQDPFLNAVAALETSLPPSELLRELKRLESDLGRVPGPRWGPREIDLDLLLYDDLVLREQDLEVPHPRMAERVFVMEPLAEIAPEVVHPVLKKTIRDLWEDLRSRDREDSPCT
jgi:2-amino-4-hydroxy-6-hydroxymethyldihydropteridine diphosphokinase